MKNVSNLKAVPVDSRRIMAKDISISNDTHVTHLNNNDLVVGVSGGGKTRGYVIPNILHTEDNLIVTDTKGNLCRKYGDYLRKKGYKVMHLDFADTLHSPWGYNPLSYINQIDDPRLIENNDAYDVQDVKKVAQALCPIQDAQEPVWDMQAQMYLEAILLYILNWLPEEQHNLYEAYVFLSRMKEKDFMSMLDENCREYPESTFALKYGVISNARDAEKMYASILGILSQHMDVVSHMGARHMFETKDQIDLKDFLEEKTALFLTVSDVERTQDNLVNLFYTQALQYLTKAADSCSDSRLPIPVRFILDDFSTNTLIPDFDKTMSVIRSREIYASIIIQSISQLEGLYGASRAQTIINNCDHCLYLGSTDVTTAHFFAEKANCLPSTVLDLPLDSMYLFSRGSKPMKVARYDLSMDEVYCRLESGTGEDSGGEPVK